MVLVENPSAATKAGPSRLRRLRSNSAGVPNPQHGVTIEQTAAAPRKSHFLLTAGGGCAGSIGILGGSCGIIQLLCFFFSISLLLYLCSFLQRDGQRSQSNHRLSFDPKPQSRVNVCWLCFLVLMSLRMRLWCPSTLHDHTDLISVHNLSPTTGGTTVSLLWTV